MCCKKKKKKKKKKKLGPQSSNNKSKNTCNEGPSQMTLICVLCFLGVWVLWVSSIVWFENLIPHPPTTPTHDIITPQFFSFFLSTPDSPPDYWVSQLQMLLSTLVDQGFHERERERERESVYRKFLGERERERESPCIANFWVFVINNNLPPTFPSCFKFHTRVFFSFLFCPSLTTSSSSSFSFCCCCCCGCILF